MTKSKKIYRAMLAVVDCDKFSAADRLEILEVLAHEKSMAEMVEEYEEKQIDGNKIYVGTLKEENANG